MNSYLRKHSLREFIDNINSKNTTLRIEQSFSQIIPGNPLSQSVEIDVDVIVPAT
jgi:dsDNA-specific endonuclease/ATPase MutS2